MPEEGISSNIGRLIASSVKKVDVKLNSVSNLGHLKKFACFILVNLLNSGNPHITPLIDIWSWDKMASVAAFMDGFATAPAVER